MVKSNKISTLGGDHEVQVATALIVATADDELVVWSNKTGRTVKITAAGFIPETKLTGAATNNLTLQFRNKGLLGTGTDGITDIKTYASGTDAEDFVEDALVLSSTAADLLVADGEVVALNKVENGTGLELPAGVAVIRFEYQ